MNNLQFNCKPHYSNEKKLIKSYRAISAINLRSPLGSGGGRGLAVAATAWHQRGLGSGSLAAARLWKRQCSGGSSSSAAAAKLKLRFREKSPQKMGVTWNLLIAVDYDNIGIFLRTEFFVP